MNIKPDLVEYLNYLVTWENETDEHINALISEVHYLLEISNYHFNPDEAVEQRFNELIALLFQIEKNIVKEMIVEFLADAFAIECICSFGLGIPLLMAAEVEYVTTAWAISDEIQLFNQKLKTIDFSIVQDMGEPVKNYLVTYKANNQIIAEKGNSRINLLECRVYLLQFMFEVYSKTGKLDVQTFKTWAASAKKIYNSQEIQEVNDALQKVDASQGIDSCIDIISRVISSTNDQISTSLVVGLSFFTMSYDRKIKSDTIKSVADAKGIPPEYVSDTAFKIRETVGNLADNLTVTKKIIDEVLKMCQMIKVIDQVVAWDNTLIGSQSFQLHYKQYFSNLKQASTSFSVVMNMS